MCPDKKRPAENTCRIVKGLDAVWAHFCPSKPCLPLSIDGILIAAQRQCEEIYIETEDPSDGEDA